jgi:hypothetical protein
LSAILSNRRIAKAFNPADYLILLAILINRSSISEIVQSEEGETSHDYDQDGKTGARRDPPNLTSCTSRSYRRRRCRQWLHRAATLDRAGPADGSVMTSGRLAPVTTRNASVVDRGVGMLITL